MTKLQTKTWLKNKLATNAKWALRALNVIYSRQTLSEQACNATIEHNSVGFSGCDAEILTSFAQQVERGRTLSEKQMAIVFRKMPRYWGQILSTIPQDKLAKYESEIVASQAVAMQ